MKRGQISIELIVVVGLLFLILLFLIGLSFTKKIELTKTEAYLSQRKECLKLSSVISEIYTNGNRTAVSYKLSYNATLFSDSRLIEIIDKESVFCTLPINSISDTNLNKGDIEIKNLGDFIYVSNI